MTCVNPSKKVHLAAQIDLLSLSFFLSLSFLLSFCSFCPCANRCSPCVYFAIAIDAAIAVAIVVAIVVAIAVAVAVADGTDVSDFEYKAFAYAYISVKNARMGNLHDNGLRLPSSEDQLAEWTDWKSVKEALGLFTYAYVVHGDNYAFRVMVICRKSIITVSNTRLLSLIALLFGCVFAHCVLPFSFFSFFSTCSLCVQAFVHSSSFGAIMSLTCNLDEWRPSGLLDWKSLRNFLKYTCTPTH